MVRRGRFWVACGTVFVLFFVGGVCAGFAGYTRYLGEVKRIGGVFAELDEAARPQPAPPAADGRPPTVFLLVGTDTVADGPTTGAGATWSAADGRSDAIMLARLAADGSRADVVSIPRDSWVDVPGHGRRKVNAAFALGGPSLLVRVVEDLTRVRVDHFAVVDFRGFVALADALGGVEVEVSTASTNLGYQFRPGAQVVSGEEALAFVRDRRNLPHGDFDRVRRQHAYLRGVLATLRGQQVWTNPGALDGVLRAVTSALSIDAGVSDLDLVAYAQRVGALEADNVTFLTAPVRAVGWEGDQSVVYLDDGLGRALWRHFADGTLGGAADQFPPPTLGG